MSSDGETRYVCSDCGYSRTSEKSVVEHITRNHEDTARVMEYEPAEGSPRTESRVLRWIKRRLR